MDEPEATAIYGEPLDCSPDGLKLDNLEEEQPPFSSHELSSKYPRSSKFSASSSSSNSNSFDLELTNGQRRNSTSSKKGVQRPVRIQLIDSAESEMLREQVRRASTSDQSASWNPEDEAIQEDTTGDDDGNVILINDSDNEADIALPKEDPTIHDWDKEELEDEMSGSEISSSTRDSSPQPQPRDKNRLRRDVMMVSSPDTDFELRRTSSRIRHAASTGRTRSNHHDDDDDWDPLLDPEREVPAMSEDQEADLHNIHLRLENQREFQDAAGLDLGEDDAQAVNEDGQYGGKIEDDDEGEDYWENR
ncbi:hypothetical protein BGZ65_009270 [Modicella reniformis]|uniref:Uncharacterized protein n=1 Tax=Modicella reniformis TaxID=1440133 RepID=A0A9P6MEK5_9FUNG|nr:hypothetical protein BGZ65_009270 [Modicella reniformis]